MKTSPLAPLVLLLALAASAAAAPRRQQPAQDPATTGAADVAPDAARAAWDRLLAAAVKAEAAGEPIRAFDLHFDGRARPRPAQTNDFDAARFRYLAPGWVRTTLRNDRERMRGPDGDFALEEGRVIELKGRDYAEDRRELAERAAIARNFTALSNPAEIRVQDLAALPAPPDALPEALAKRAAELEWITLRSPDLRVVRLEASPRGEDGEAEPLFRVQLGLDRTTGLAALATIAEEVDGRPRASSSLLIDLRRYRAMDGFQVPGEVRTHRPGDLTDAGWRYADKPSLELWLLEGGSLRPALGPDDFRP